MGRRREYPSATERQRAFRQRQSAEWVRVERRRWEQLHRRLEELQEAVRGAGAVGDPTAMACRAVSAETVLEKLIRHFEGEARGTGLGAKEEGSP